MTIINRSLQLSQATGWRGKPSPSPSLKGVRYVIVGKSFLEQNINEQFRNVRCIINVLINIIEILVTQHTFFLLKSSLSYSWCFFFFKTSSWHFIHVSCLRIWWLLSAMFDSYYCHGSASNCSLACFVMLPKRLMWSFSLFRICWALKVAENFLKIKLFRCVYIFSPRTTSSLDTYSDIHYIWKIIIKIKTWFYEQLRYCKNLEFSKKKNKKKKAFLLLIDTIQMF